MKVDPLVQQHTSKEDLEDHAYNAYGGIGKQFNISRKIKGSVLGLYRFELDGYMPASSKVNVRLGFHYDFAKKKRQSFLARGK